MILFYIALHSSKVPAAIHYHTANIFGTMASDIPYFLIFKHPEAYIHT
jgi:hypothetical protein